VKLADPDSQFWKDLLDSIAFRIISVDHREVRAVIIFLYRPAQRRYFVPTEAPHRLPTARDFQTAVESVLRTTKLDGHPLSARCHLPAASCRRHCVSLTIRWLIEAVTSIPILRFLE